MGMSEVYAELLVHLHRNQDIVVCLSLNGAELMGAVQRYLEDNPLGTPAPNFEHKYLSRCDSRFHISCEQCSHSWRRCSIVFGLPHLSLQGSDLLLVLGSLLSWWFCLKGVSHEIFRALFWHVWIDLGLFKNLRLFLIFTVEPLILYLCLKFRPS